MLSKLKTYAPTQMVMAISVFAVLAVHTRYLKIEQYGILALVLACVEIIRLFTGQWVNSTFIRFYSNASLALKGEINNFSLQMIASLFVPALIVFFVIKEFYAPLEQSSLALVFLLLCVKTYFLYFQQLARLNEEKLSFHATSLIQAITSVILTWWLLSYWPVVDAALIALILSYILSLLVLKPKIIFKFKAFHNIDNKIYYKYGLPLIWSGLILGLISRVDKFIIFELMDGYSVGLYSAVGAMLLGLTSLGFMLIALPLYPEVVKYVQDRKKLQDEHAKYLAILMTVTLPVLIFLCFISDPLTKILLGEKYTKFSGVAFSLLAFSAYLLNIKSHYLDHGLQFSLKTGATPYIAFTSLLVNLLAGYWFTKQYGLLGASAAVFMTTLCLVFMTWYVAIKSHYIFFINACCKKIVACNAAYFIFLLGLTAVISFKSPVVYLIFFGVSSVLFYVLIIFFINPFEIKKISNIWALMRK